MHPKSLSIRDFTYELPQEKIAVRPLPERDASRLLVYQQGTLAEDTYRGIARYLPADSLLVFNNTRVIEARLLFQKPSGGVIEIFCLDPDASYNNISTALEQKGRVLWQCLIGGASKWKPGQVLQITRNNQLLSATFRERRPDCFIIEFSWEPVESTFADVLHEFGQIPLPPYIKRAAEAADSERYQTTYAAPQGSVAAPTAGLHFTDAIFRQLDEKQIRRAFVTLHVGAGTFRPVKAASMQDHNMHGEYVEVSRETVISLLKHAGSVFAVGTTSLRTLESLYQIGVQLLRNPSIATGTFEVDQWSPYDAPSTVSGAEALHALLQWMQQQGLESVSANTRIIIAPGYQFRIVRGLITNFHQPQSTLLLLVAALIGKDWTNVYDYALKNDFRFLSYGDGCLLDPLR